MLPAPHGGRKWVSPEKIRGIPIRGPFRRGESECVIHGGRRIRVAGSKHLSFRSHQILCLNVCAFLASEADPVAHPVKQETVAWQKI